MALTSPDNIANFRLNKVADGPIDARIIAAVDQAGSISLMGRPGIGAPGQIRRGTVAVDARNSGFAFLLYELLNSRGLAPDIDYRVYVAADARVGLVPDAVITPAQLELVLEIRTRWGGFSGNVDIAAEIRRPQGLIDDRFARTG